MRKQVGGHEVLERQPGQVSAVFCSPACDRLAYSLLL